MFDIEFCADEPERQDEGADAWFALRGRTTLGNHREEFLAALDPWSRADYERHWIEAARRLLGGADRTGFFTSAFRFWWVMWREGNTLFVHEQLMVPETLIAPFDLANAYRQIGERRTFSEDGQRVSEWHLELSDIRDFVERRAGQYGPA